MKKRNGFTLVELLAVIVILAIILVIAVPAITSTIKNARIGSYESTAKLIASNAETYYLTQQALGKTTITAPACSDVASLTADYGTCTITYESNGTAKVSIQALTTGNFNGCSITNATKNSAKAEGCK